MPEYDCSLWNYLKRFRIKSSEMLPFDERLNILEIIADTVVFIQKKGFCHLDLKATNILINLDKSQKWNKRDLVLADFGLAGTVNDVRGSSGTPGFGSPEQFIGIVTPTSDNYALGKLAIMVLFKWEISWNFLARPISKVEYREERIRDHPIQKVISALLNV